MNKFFTTKQNPLTKIVLALAVVAMIWAIFAVSHVFALAKGVMNESNVRVRALPNTTSDVVTTLYLKDNVQILGQEGEWYKIKTDNGKEGYMKKEFIDVTVQGDIPTLGQAPTETKSETKETPKEEVKEAPKAEDKKDAKEDTKTSNAQEVEIVKETRLLTSPTYFGIERGVVKAGEKLPKLQQIGDFIQIQKDNVSYWIYAYDAK